MLPHDDDAQRLAANSYHFDEFFSTFDIDVPRLARDALVWTHCHQRATGGSQPGQQVLERMGVHPSPLSGGCCGVAGGWGYEQGKFAMSVDCGEQILLPKVREASQDTLVVADGFSCKTQIQQAGGGRRALHLAQVMQMAREHGRAGVRDGPPEDPYYLSRPAASSRRRAGRFAGLGALAAAAFAAGVAAVRGRR